MCRKKKLLSNIQTAYKRTLRIFKLTIMACSNVAEWVSVGN